MDAPDGAWFSSGFIKAFGVAASAVIGAIGHKLLSRRVTIGDQPVGIKGEIDLKKEFVTRRDFDALVADNAKAHENLYGRLNRNDRETSEIKGLLTGMRDDLSAIKNKLFRSK